MHLSTHSRRVRDEGGAVAVVMALGTVLLLVATALVLDFGLVRLDRTNTKSAADAAVMAGLRAGDGKTGDFYTQRAVCGALAFLKVNEPALTDLPAGICASFDDTVICDPATSPPTGAATYDEEVTSGSSTYRVMIKSPMLVTEGGFPQESYGSLSNDLSTSSGCDQLGIIISHERGPVLGSLATDSKLRYRLRSIGRVKAGSNSEMSPALILLERSACSALTIGSAGTDTWVRVRGFGNAPGSIHLDSEATGGDCGTGPNQQLAQGKQNNGIVAYGAPVGGLSGLITSYATFKSQPDGRVFDNLNYVYGTPTLSVSSPITLRNKIAARNRVGRKPVDSRYRAAVRTAIAAAEPAWSYTPTTLPAGWDSAGCSPTASQLSNMIGLYINCPGASGITLSAEIKAERIVFNGFVKNGNVRMPRATEVYVNNTSASGAPVSANAISQGSGDGFCVRNSNCTTSPPVACSSTPSASRARVFIRQGNVSTSGLLRLCNSTVFLLGGDKSTGCVPTSDGTSPTSTPCASSPTSGNSRIDVTGSGSIDWTAPNEWPGVIGSGSDTDRQAAFNNFEDLAMWAESAGEYRMTGGGTMNTAGVFFSPNATPFSVGGGGDQVLTNAQFVVRRFAVNGGGKLTMTTDPLNAVSLPSLTGFTLVR